MVIISITQAPQHTAIRMNPLLRKQMLAAIRLRTDTDFHEFIDFLYAQAHDSHYTSLKQKRDKGGDGILNGDTILAIYAPEAYSLNDFKKKITSDYKKYDTNWRSTHPKWMVLTNCDLLANMVQHIESKQSSAQKLGPVEIMTKIEGLSWTKIRRVAEFLGIATEFLINDLLGQVIDDLMRMDEDGIATSQRPHALYIEDKIALNYAPDEIQQATTQYSESLEYFDATQSILKSHTTTELRALRSRICGDFSALGGTFSQRFNALVARYCGKSPDDDYYRFAVVVVLTFFFEQCLIGARTLGETVC